MSARKATSMDRHLIPASAAPHTTDEQPMTEAETLRVGRIEDEVRELGRWRVEHETKCTARHEATGVRFDIAKREMITAFEISGMKIAAQIEKSNSLRLIGMVALGVLVVAVGIKQPAALFELLTKIP